MADVPPRILIVDDQRAVREELAFALTYEGLQVVEAGDGQAALQALTQDIGAVLLDIKMPGMDGFEVLEKMLAQQPDLKVILITGHGDIDTAVVAIKKGAYDFLQKPFANDRVLVSVKNALQQASLARENKDLRSTIAKDQSLIGTSAAMQQVRTLIDKVAPTEATALITGENGTGKELVARQIHRLSRRSQQPFVAINCAAIPAELVESELFGHEKGAFTGAQSARGGCFEQAHHGTLFLDEIGDMPLPMQAKLLRALQEQVVVRVGGSKEIKVDVRLIAATNQDLQQMVEKKEFREDLFWRLHVVRIHLPPLRERPDDLAELAPHFLAAACARNGLPKKKIARTGFEWLRTQRWPGNVRQLRNVIEGAAILAEGQELGKDELVAVATPVPAATSGGVDWFAFETIEEFGAATEKEFIRRKLLENGGNIKRTAERIDLQRSNLYKKLERYGLK